MEWTDQDRVKEVNSRDKELQINETYDRLEILERVGTDTRILYNKDKTKVNYNAVVDGITVRLLNTYGLSKVGYIQDVLEQNKLDLGIDEVYRYPGRIKIHKNNMYFDIYNQENKVLIKDEYDKDILNITLSFSSNVRIKEIQCREKILEAVKGL